MNDAPEVRCPTCGKPVLIGGESFPFCCRRCRLIDLGAWIDGRHAIPGRPGSADADEDGR